LKTGCNEPPRRVLRNTLLFTLWGRDKAILARARALERLCMWPLLNPRPGLSDIDRSQNPKPTAATDKCVLDGGQAGLPD
jgi:hypothetical protein